MDRTSYALAAVFLSSSFTLLALPGRAALRPGLSHVHRGGGACDRPDNTLETFKWAWANGAGVECDCRFTGDRVPIMLHDGNLRRTGRVAPGDERLLTNAVSKLTFEEIRRVDVGRYLGERFAGERVPSLDEVFAAMKGHPSYTLFVDDKGIGPEFLAERAVAAGLLGQTYYTTCSYRDIAKWHAITGGKGKSRLWLGPGTSKHDAESVSRGEARCDRMLAEARKGEWKGVTIVCIDVNYDPKGEEPFVPGEAYLKRLRDELREHGVGFTAIPYQGGGSAEVYRKLVEIGVDGLCTDHPKVLFASGLLAPAPVDAETGCKLSCYVRTPDPEEHAPIKRAATLVPSIAVAQNGRLWATWYCGVTPAEDVNNYVVLATSGDGGGTWNEVFVADPDGGGMRRAFDPEVWVAPDGTLRWTWTDRSCRDRSGGGYDARNDALMMATLPNADEVPPEPPTARAIAEGVMMCKPTVLRDGTWAFPVAHWGGSPWSSCLYVSTDGGRTFALRGGAKIPEQDAEFDEHLFVERENGDLMCYARAKSGIREAVSTDGGFTWSAPRPSALPHPSARFFVRRLASGAWLLVKHGGLDKASRRERLTAYVSDDEGSTWKGGLLLEERFECSYPDGQEAPDGTIYLVYDWNRYRDQTIFFCTFTEADIRAGRDVSGRVRLRQVVSRGGSRD